MTKKTEFLTAPGEAIDPPLKIEKARDLAELLQQNQIDYATFVECRKTSGGEVVVFDVEVELGQRLANDIRPIERIVVEFHTDDSVMPAVLALRADFPLVPHINLRTEEFPRSLCLYDRPYRELKRQWTAPQFVERVREWLRLTAKGKLHDADQPLEPLLLTHAGTIVLPLSLTSGEVEQFRPLYVTATNLEAGDAYYIARIVRPEKKASQGVPFAACVLSCSPQQHGVIRRQPHTIAELSELVADAGLELLPFLSAQIQECRDELGKEDGAFLDAPLIIIIRFPKTRVADGPVESTDVFVFLTFQTVREVGIDIGMWVDVDGMLGAVIGSAEDRTGSTIQIDALDPVYEFDRAWAMVLSGHESSQQVAVAAIGAGALGSQVILNAARGGFGCDWKIIDEDRLNPHNLARHVLDGAHVGYHKTVTVAHLANSLTPSGSPFSSIVADVLRPGNKSDELAKAFRDADTILDMSASVTVARHIVHAVQSDAQRMSLFLNASGQDLVLLAESQDRKVPLDALEMQYYRAIINDPAMDGHFVVRDSRQRYGQSCRDVTLTISQELVGMHAAIGARAVRLGAGADISQISVWRSSPNHSVTRVDVPTTSVACHKMGDWTLLVDGHVFQRLAKLREEKLPNETGGVLLGSFDLERKTAYIVDTIPSPPDSEEWPTLYIRGCRGLEHQVKAVHKRTDGMLHYVGEWHSHPDGCSTRPSEDDILVFSWLTERMNSDGFPALMMIAGEGAAVNPFLGRIERIENLIPVPLS